MNKRHAQAWTELSPDALGSLPSRALALLLSAALLTHASWLSPALTLLLALLIGLKLLWQWRFARAVPQIIRIFLFVLCLAVVILTTGSPVSRDGGVAMLLALCTLKFLESSTVRDGRMLVAAVLFLTMTQFLFDQGLWAVICALLITAMAFSALNLLHKHHAQSNPQATWVDGWRAASFSSRVVVAALPLAIGAFIFFPRLGQPLWGAPWDSRQGKTGIGDEMRPGMLSKLWPDDSPVFRVTFEGTIPAPRDLYWRGPVLWSFDGQAWRRARWDEASLDYPMRHDANSTISYEVLLEPTEKRWYFPLDLALAAAPGSRLLADGQMLAHRPIISPKRLQLRSATRYVFEQELMRGHRWAATYLPENSNPQAFALAEKWRSQGKNSEAIIAAALELFHQSFSYSLEPPPLAPERSIDEFLFETKSGYCEHFSSAFAFLMRASNIPARVVTGYLGGYYNRAGNYWVVRNSDAHAWTEVWLQDRGWVRVDPTSAVAPERIDRGSNESAIPAANRWYSNGWASSWRDRLDVISRWWRNQVVDFDAVRQSLLLTSLGIEKTEWKHLLIGLAISSALTMFLGAWWMLRSSRQVVQDPLLNAWNRFNETLQGVGIARRTDEDPMVYARRAAHSLPKDAAIILHLGNAFSQLRYGSHAPVGTDRPLIRRLQRFRPIRP